MHIFSRIDRIKQPAVAARGELARIFTLASLEERPRVGSGGLLATITLHTAHTTSSAATVFAAGATALAGKYFTRIAKVTDRIELRSFELHRTVRQRKIMAPR